MTRPASTEIDSSVAVPVNTLRGPLAPDELGITLVHEHVVADISALWTPPTDARRDAMVQAPVGALDAALLGRDPLVCRDNCRLDDEDLAVAELADFAEAGGATVVECTSEGLGRDIAALSRVGRRTGVNIVAPTGFYLWHSCRDLIGDWSVARITEYMIRDITEGIPSTAGVRAGVIGEIGTSSPLHEQEIRVLRAAGAAQHVTGVPIAVHLDQAGREGDQVLDLLADAGADLSRVVLGHIDQRHDRDVAYPAHLAGRGALLGFDTFGTVFAYDAVGEQDPTDADRITLLAAVLREGFADRCVLSHDVGMKNMLRRYGGGGYAHLLVDLTAAFERAGISPEQVETMLVANPRRWLAGV